MAYITLATSIASAYQRLMIVVKQPERGSSLRRNLVRLAMDTHELYEACKAANYDFIPDQELLELRAAANAEFPTPDFFMDTRAIYTFLNEMNNRLPSDSLPVFPYHRDPVRSGSVRPSEARCECCGQARGTLYAGVMYAREAPQSLCPWCIADGSAAERHQGHFFDASFCDDNFQPVEMPIEWSHTVFALTIGFATFNPIHWWIHCGEPAEYINRIAL